MITTVKEYNDYMNGIISGPSKKENSENFLQINLNTRTIDMSNMTNLGVIGDHNAETLWFKVDRYFDKMDLSKTHIAIQCRNANPDPVDENNEFIFLVGSNISSDNDFNQNISTDEENLYFPWTLNKAVSQYSGVVQFSIRFFQKSGDSYVYSLNTQVAQFNISNGLDTKDNGNNYDILSPNEWESFIEKVDLIYGLVATEDEEGNPISFSRDYNSLLNRPKINGVVLEGNQTAADLGIAVPDDYLAEDDIGEGFTDETENKLVSKSALDTRFSAIEEEVNGLKEITPLDSTPTEGSEKGITSGGVHEALRHVSIEIDSSLNKTSTNPVQNKIIAEKIEELENAMGNLTYVPLTIDSFRLTNPYAEKGTEIKLVQLEWSLSRTPNSLTINDESYSVDATSAQISTTVNSDTTYTLKATTNSEIVTAEATLSFVERVSYGVGTVPSAGYSSGFITGLNSSIQPTREITFTTTAREGEYIYVALPTSYGTPTFKVGGFEGGFEKVTSDPGLSYTRNGYVSAYHIYKSTNPNLGTTTIQVC